MSANSAVTVLRSPSSAAESAMVCSGATPTSEAGHRGDDVAAAAPASLVSGAPHLPQKSEVGGLSALHFAHCLESAFPHFAQKLFVEGLFVPHFEQRMPVDLGERLARLVSPNPTDGTDRTAPDACKQASGMTRLACRRATF